MRSVQQTRRIEALARSGVGLAVRAGLAAPLPPPLPTRLLLTTAELLLLAAPGTFWFTMNDWGGNKASLISGVSWQKSAASSRERGRTGGPESCDDGAPVYPIKMILVFLFIISKSADLFHLIFFNFLL